MHRDYTTAAWFQLRKQVLHDAGYTCHICGAVAETVHHVSYKGGIICNPRWLRAVCWRCHLELHIKEYPTMEWGMQARN